MTLICALLLIAFSPLVGLALFIAGYFLCALIWASAIAGLRTITTMAALSARGGSC